MRRAECWGLGAEVRLEGDPEWSRGTRAVACDVVRSQGALPEDKHTPRHAPRGLGERLVWGLGGGALCKRQT